MLNTRNHEALVQIQAAAAQSRSEERLLDFTVGSILRALIEATAGVALWLQGLILRTLAASRASTSDGEDLDSWMADFGLARLQSSPAIGMVTFSRFTPGAQAVIPLGALVQTADGRQRFQVTLDATHGAWNAGLQGYVMPVSQASIHLPVASLEGSVQANVQAGTITQIVSTILYVDTVTNAAPMEGGAEQETDDAFRKRFHLFILSLSRATKHAIGYAVTSLRLGITYTLTENEQYDGSHRTGYFYVVADDGTGSPPDELITNVTAAIELYRPASVLFNVFKPQVHEVLASMVLTVRSGYHGPTVIAAVGISIRKAIEAIPVGEGLAYTKLAQLAYEAHPGVQNVTQLLLDTDTADIPADSKVKLMPGTIVVS